MRKAYFKKIGSAFLAVALLLSVCLGSASAVVFYVEETGTYSSNDEADGTLSFQYSDTAAIAYELSGYLEDKEWRYLENLVPTDDLVETDNPVYFSNVPVALNEMDRSMLSQYTYDYTPTEDRLMFRWDAVDADTINVEVMDVASGDIIARGYHLAAGQAFKSSVNVAGRQLRIFVTSDSIRRNAIQLSFSSSDSAAAETFVPAAAYDMPDNDAIENQIAVAASDKYFDKKSFTSSKVPKNVDGTQGKIIGQYTPGGKGSCIIHVQFTKTTDGMKSVNVALLIDTVDVAWETLNLREWYNTSIAGTKEEYNVRVSTNSATGKNATIECSHT